MRSNVWAQLAGLALRKLYRWSTGGIDGSELRLGGRRFDLLWRHAVCTRLSHNKRARCSNSLDTSTFGVEAPVVRPRAGGPSAAET